MRSEYCQNCTRFDCVDNWCLHFDMPTNANWVCLQIPTAFEPVPEDGENDDDEK